MLCLSTLGKSGPAGFERCKTQLFSVWKILETTHKYPPSAHPHPDTNADTQARWASATSESPISKSSSRAGLLQASRKLHEVIHKRNHRTTESLPYYFLLLGHLNLPAPTPPSSPFCSRLANFARENHKLHTKPYKLHELAHIHDILRPWCPYSPLGGNTVQHSSCRSYVKPTSLQGNPPASSLHFLCGSHSWTTQPEFPQIPSTWQSLSCLSSYRP